MKRFFGFATLPCVIVVLGCLCAFMGCKQPTSASSGTDEPTDTEPAYNVSLSDVSVKDAEALGSSGFKKIVFTYPTKNVAGKTVQASAVIVIPNAIYDAETKPTLDYMVLSSHGASTLDAEAPSNSTGDVCNLTRLIGSKNAVGIAPDYIGFGESADQLQAFSYGDVNARTALQAVICARLWLKEQGYTWEDKLANVGFSQGGQTAMHVQKLVDTTDVYGSKVTVTKTFAGGGVYDIVAMVNYSIADYNPPLMPSTVWLGLATYNELSGLGYELGDIFTPDYVTNVQNLLDKKVSLMGELNEYGGTFLNVKWSDSLTADMLNEDSDIRKDIAQKTAAFNCNFTPKSTSKIFMFAASNDDVVPSKMSDALYAYFNDNGFAMEKVESAATTVDCSGDNVYASYSVTGGTYGVHMAAQAAFIAGVATELQTTNW